MATRGDLVEEVVPHVGWNLHSPDARCGEREAIAGPVPAPQHDFLGTHETAGGEELLEPGVCDLAPNSPDHVMGPALAEPGLTGGIDADAKCRSEVPRFERDEVDLARELDLA